MQNVKWMSLIQLQNNCRALEEARELLRDAPRGKKKKSAFFEDEVCWPASDRATLSWTGTAHAVRMGRTQPDSALDWLSFAG